MKNITLSIDEETLRRARIAAQSTGKSVNQLVREYLSQLGSSSCIEEQMDEFRALSMRSGGHSKGWKFNREEAHERG